VIITINYIYKTRAIVKNRKQSSNVINKEDQVIKVTKVTSDRVAVTVTSDHNPNTLLSTWSVKVYRHLSMVGILSVNSIQCLRTVLVGTLVLNKMLDVTINTNHT